MKILKFGGSSISNSDRIKNVIKLVVASYSENPKIAVVVSAFGGATNDLIHAGNLARKGDIEFRKVLKEIKDRHIEVGRELSRTKQCTTMAHMFHSLEEFLEGVFLVRDLSLHSKDYLLSFGERLSACIIAEAFKGSLPSAFFLDSRDLVITDNHFGSAQFIKDITYPLIENYFKNINGVPVITGFIGKTEQGETTTLGRGGSDLTATIFGAALNAEVIEIWTDVDGVMTADPKIVSTAFPIPRLTFREASEMSHFGAKVIYPRSIHPAEEREIPIKIINTFNPYGSNTLISNDKKINIFNIAGIASIENINLIRMEGPESNQRSQLINRFLTVLGKLDVEIYMISQGSVELSITIAIDSTETNLVIEALKNEFYLEIQNKIVEPIGKVTGLVAVAIINENTRIIPGLAGRFLGTLGRNNINVVGMIGTSACNVLAVIKKEDHFKAMQVTHQEFFHFEKMLNVFVVGLGNIGKVLLNQIALQLPVLRSKHNVDIKIIGLANTKKMIIDRNGINIDEWESIFEKGENTNLRSFLESMKTMKLDHTVFVDCTSSQDISDQYPSILESHISIVTPNKKAISGPYVNYAKLKELSKNQGRLYYETNVGAGLPIISTITDLIRSGDIIHKIEGVLSGTLSFVFNSINKDVGFSEALLSAYKHGYTEPDPREDLSCKDISRKLLILVREIGYPLESEDIQIDELLPKEVNLEGTVDHFFENLKKIDPYFEELREQAKKEHKVLRLIASFENEKAEIKLKAVGPDHPFYYLSGPNNIISITTERYKQNPIVIKGPGAGADVTAGEIFADMLRILIN